MARAINEDPLKVFQFAIEESGLRRAGFQTVSGLQSTTEVAEYREGGYATTARKSAGMTAFGNVTLGRGQIIGGAAGGDNDLLDWASQIHNCLAVGTALNYRRDLDIVQFDATNVEARRWTLYEAWPVRFKPFSDLSGTSNDNSIEELELANEGFTLVGP